MLTEYYNQLALSKDSLSATSSYLGGPNLFSNLQKNNTSMRPIVDQKLATPIQGLYYCLDFYNFEIIYFGFLDLASYGFPSTNKSIIDKSQKKGNKTNDSKKHSSSEHKNKVDLSSFSYTKPLSFTDIKKSLNEPALPVNTYMSGRSNSSQLNKELKMQEFSRQLSYENIKSSNKMSSMQQINQSLKKTNVSNKVPDRQNMISPSYNHPLPGPTQFRYNNFNP